MLSDTMRTHASVKRFSQHYNAPLESTSAPAAALSLRHYGRLPRPAQVPDLRECLELDFAIRHPPMLCSMSDTPKVVALDQQRFRVIAADEKTSRIIIAIGRQRIALDMSTRITELPPDVGDKPAKILLITPRKRRSRKS